MDYRSAAPKDSEQINEILRQNWGETRIVSKGVVHDAALLPAFVAVENKEIVGLLTYRIANHECEIVTLNSIGRQQGVGTSLLQLLRRQIEAEGLRRIWLVTTNDNLDALRFYQRRGFRLVAVHVNALDASRKIKPSIPLVGAWAIPIRDEIELEVSLAGASS